MTTRELEVLRRYGAVPDPDDAERWDLIRKVEGWRREELRQAQAQGILIGAMLMAGIFAAVVFLNALGIR